MKKWNTITIVVCIATAIICTALTFWGNWKNDGVLTTDAFIGVLATFIGICATIIVGFQIVSFVKIHETERQIKVLQQERARIQEQNKRLEDISTYLGEDLSNALVIIAKESTDNLVQIVAYMMSIYCCNMGTADKEVILLRYRCLRDSINKASTKERVAVSEQVYRLKDLNLPKNIQSYTDIMKLHYECLSILENATQEVKD